METGKIALRPATLEDAERLWKWRNDSLTRANSLNSEEIDWDQHVRWLGWNLRDQFVRIHIGMLAGVEIGLVRVEHENTGCWMSWTVAPECRGQGLGYCLVKTVVDATPGRIKATIKADNIASIRIAEKLDFALETEKDGVHHYALTPEGYVPDPLAVLRHL